MIFTKLKVVSAILLAASLVVGGAGMLTARVLCERPDGEQLREALPIHAPWERPEPGKKADTRLDCFGDPLPPGAISRLGSLRLYHGQKICCVTVAPDSQTVVGSVHPGGESRLWSLSTGKEQPLPMNLKAAFFFAAGGKLIAVQRQNRGLGIWDVSAGKEMVHLAGAFQGPFALSPDGKVLVKWSGQPIAGLPRDKLIFTDLYSGTLLRTIELEGRKQVHTFAYSGNGKTLGAKFFNGSLDVWDTSDGVLLLSLPSGKGGGFGSFSLSPDGTTLAAYGPAEKRVRIWNIPTRKEQLPFSLKKGGRETSLGFSSDGKFLATTYEDSVGLWDLKTRKEIRRFQGAERGIQAPSFTPNGKHLCAADGTRISIWDLATGERLHDYGHHYVIDGLAFAPDGKTVVSGAAYCDPVVRIWDPWTGRARGKWRGHTSGIEVVAFSPGGDLVASGSQDGTVRLWDPRTGTEKKCLEAKDGMVYGMAFGPDGKTIASGGQQKAIHLWDLATGRELRSFDNPGNWVLKVAWSPDGQFLTTRGFGEDIVRVWDVISGKELRRLHGPGAGCPSLAFSPDSTLLASGADDGTIRLWNIHTGSEIIRELGPDPKERHRSFTVAFSPDGRTLAAGYEGGMVCLWELWSGQERARYLGHQGGAYRVAFSPDGSLLASGGTDHTALIWDVTGQRTRFPFLRGPWIARDLENLWTNLAARDAAEAYKALQTLHAAEQKAVELLSKRLRPAQVVDTERIPRLIKDLDHDEFAVRERASRELEKFGDRIAAQLQQALANQPSPELRRRLEVLLEQGNVAHNPDKLRGLRAVEVLERIGSANAQQVLETLAQGSAEDQVTQEAKAALKRLAK